MTITSLKQKKWIRFILTPTLLLGSFLLYGQAYAISAPTVSSYPSYASSTPVTVSGTADASSTITITGGASTSTASVNGSGDWSASVDLTPNTVNHLSVTADDGMGSTSLATMIDITFDTQAPVFGTTTDVTATTTSSSGTTVDFVNPIATDNIDSSVAVSCSPGSGQFFSLGTTTVGCMASDNSGNTASTSFDVIVNQVGNNGTTTGTTTNPIDEVLVTNPIFASGLYCSTTTPVNFQGVGTASTTEVRISGGLGGTATTTVDGSGNWTADINLASNTNSTVTIDYLDAGGNVIATKSFDLAFDTTAPVISFGNSTSTGAFVGTGFGLGMGVTVTDNLDSNVTYTTTGDFSSTTVGTYHVVYTATDCAGNTASSTRTIEILPVGSSGGGNGGGGGSSIPPGLIIANQVANPNSAVAYVLAGFIINGRGTVGIPNTGGGFTFVTLMKMGLRGAEVTELQTLLKELGYYKGPITGYFGPLTRSALMAYQRAHGIEATGNVGVKTLASLNASILANR